MKTLFLFDMDGTLTPPREKMPLSAEMLLGKIQHAGHEVGIITGSDMDYIYQQCSNLFDLSLLNTSSVHFLPCNGTKYMLNNKFIYSKNMKQEMGNNQWRLLMTYLIRQQNKLCTTLTSAFPLTGHFFNYRQSMVNWCPIGRNATLLDRALWDLLDENNKIRQPLIEELQSFVKSAEMNLSVKLGGDTSFDIYPVGWDKTYPLTNTDCFDDYDKIYFVGDRCEENGNDFEIYEHHRTEAYKTTGVEHTCEIVNKILSSNVS
mgnify:FL=1|tara:strand:- start:4609 stop:5391 length:783 start_codon:yes stop_codon:yes gene_type:complete